MTSFTKKLGAFAFALSLALTAPAATLSAADDVASLVQRSYDLEGSSKYAESLAALDQLPASNQATFVVQLRRGWLLYLLGRYDESTAAYQKATSFEPAAVEARLGASRSLLALRKWGEAEKECREVLTRDGSNYYGSSRLAFALYNQGRYADALVYYKKMVELYPSDVEMRNGVGWSQIKLGDAAAAAKSFRAVLDVAPRNASAQEGLKAAGVTK
jgi:tetratricopeptide (TPR) repeat protein